MESNDRKEQFIEMRAKGISYDKISRALAVSKPTLVRWSKGLSQTIKNMKAIELEVLLEKYYATKVKRIELFGEKLKCIKDELDKRELSEVSTEKLFELYVRFIEILKKEVVDVVFSAESDVIEMVHKMSEEIKKTFLVEDKCLDNNCIVSTVKLRRDLGSEIFGHKPLLFETMIFGGKNNHYQNRNSTKKRALLQHKKILMCLKAGIDCEELDSDE